MASSRPAPDLSTAYAPYEPLSAPGAQPYRSQDYGAQPYGSEAYGSPAYGSQAYGYGSQAYGHAVSTAAATTAGTGTATVGAGTAAVADTRAFPPDAPAREALAREEERWTEWKAAVPVGEPGTGPAETWNPTAETVRPVRGRHRVKQRGGFARSGTVLGVGVIAAVGAGGIATADEGPRLPISVPDVDAFAKDVSSKLPDAKTLPGVGQLVADDSAEVTTTAAGPLTQAGAALDGGAQGRGAGEALRTRILEQAEQAQNAAEQDAREAAERSALKRAEAEAAKLRDEAAAAREAAKEEARRKAAEAAREKAEAERAARLAELARSYTLPVSSFTLTALFGQAGDRWSADHTGTDFAAPTGTPVKAIHSGTITEAGWAGSYGYRVIVTLDDGTELWYCHLSSILKTSGKVNTNDLIARVGATGNVSGPHLHLEVRPSTDSPIDPLSWLRERGLSI